MSTHPTWTRGALKSQRLPFENPFAAKVKRAIAMPYLIPAPKPSQVNDMNEMERSNHTSLHYPLLSAVEIDIWNMFSSNILESKQILDAEIPIFEEKMFQNLVVFLQIPFFSVFRSLACLSVMFLAKTQLGQNAIRPYVFESKKKIYIYVGPRLRKIYI